MAMNPQNQNVLGQMTTAIDLGFKIIRGLVALQDEPLQEERLSFLFDLDSKFINSKPLLTLLKQLA